MLTRLFVTSILFATLSGVSGQNAYGAQPAEDRDPIEHQNSLWGIPPLRQALKIGNQEFSRAQVIWDFLNVAFDDQLPYEHLTGHPEYREGPDASVSVSAYNNFLPYEQFLESYQKYSWGQEYVFRREGVPNHDAINKWTQRITIGIDWPRYQAEHAFSSMHGGIPPAIHVPEDRDWKQNRHYDAYPIIADQISRLIPDIERLTGLSVEFYNPDDPRESTDGFARIRIVPMGTGSLNNYFKHKYAGGSLYFSHVFGEVRFTPAALTQVEGVFIPNANNEIDFSACPIFPFLNAENLFRALISECVVRSLGLPEMAQLNNDALLGRWNRAYEPYSSVPIPRYAWDASETPPPGVKDAHQWFVDQFFYPAIEGRDFPISLAAYDKFLISLLYCPDIRPGMDKNAIIWRLNSSDTCFSDYLTADKRKGD